MSSLIKSVIAQAMVRDVGYGVPSQDQVSTAVDAYLQRNPVEPGATTEEAAQIQKNADDIKELKQNGTGNNSGWNVDLTGYATQQWVQDGYQPKGEYLESTQLAAAVEEALAQAKKSGELKGDAYVLTEEDRAEIAASVLEALPAWEGGSY